MKSSRNNRRTNSGMLKQQQQPRQDNHQEQDKRQSVRKTVKNNNYFRPWWLFLLSPLLCCFLGQTSTITLRSSDCPWRWIGARICVIYVYWIIVLFFSRINQSPWPLTFVKDEFDSKKWKESGRLFGVSAQPTEVVWRSQWSRAVDATCQGRPQFTFYLWQAPGERINTRGKRWPRPERYYPHPIPTF